MTKKKAVKRADKTARDVLNMLDTFLSSDKTDNDERQKLWNILTALRGPDNDDIYQKERTTVPIRRAAFPKMAEQSDIWPCGAQFMSFSIANVPDFTPRDDDTHFDFHARAAARALGLYPPERK